MTFGEIMRLPFSIDHYGHAVVCLRNHPLTRKDGTVRRNRLVAFEVLGVDLQSDDAVHHRNGIRDDDDPSNLDVMKFADHSRHHMWGNEYGRANKGRAMTWGDKIAAKTKGTKRPEHSARLKGRKPSETERANFLASVKWGSDHPNFGRHWKVKCSRCGKQGANARSHWLHVATGAFIEPPSARVA